MDRRAFLRGVTLTTIPAIAGCGARGGEGSPTAGDSAGGSGDADDDGYADSGDDYPDDPSRWRTLRSVSERIELDEYRSWSFEFSQRMILTYSVRVLDGPDIDALLLTADQFSAFEEGSEWRPYSTASVLDSAVANVRTPLGGGAYVFVVDNTDRGGAKPPSENGRATVEVELELSR